MFIFERSPGINRNSCLLKERKLNVYRNKNKTTQDFFYFQADQPIECGAPENGFTVSRLLG